MEKHCHTADLAALGASGTATRATEQALSPSREGGVRTSAWGSIAIEETRQNGPRGLVL